MDVIDFVKKSSLKIDVLEKNDRVGKADEGVFDKWKT